MYSGDSCPTGFCPVKDAYEEAVSRLEPDARPGDTYLLALDEVESDAAWAKVDDAEKRAEKLFADALANGQLMRWVKNQDGTMHHLHVRENWEPCGFPGLDSDLPDFTVPSRRDGRMVFIEKAELSRWINSRLADRKSNAPVPSDNEVRSLLRREVDKHGGYLSQEDGARFVRAKCPGFPKKRAMELVKELTGNTKPGPRGPRRKLCE